MRWNDERGALAVDLRGFSRLTAESNVNTNWPEFFIFTIVHVVRGTRRNRGGIVSLDRNMSVKR